MSKNITHAWTTCLRDWPLVQKNPPACAEGNISSWWRNTRSSDICTYRWGYREVGSSLAFFLLRLRRWSEWYSEGCYLQELFSIIEPVWVRWSCIARSWICLGLGILEEMNRLGISLEKKSAIAYQCEHTISWVYAIFSEHSLRTDIWYEWETFEDVFEGGLSGGHDELNIRLSFSFWYSSSEIRVFYIAPLLQYC